MTVRTISLFAFLICAIAQISMAQTPIRMLGQHLLPRPNANDVWGYTDASTGKEYALCGSGGVAFYDVTDPENPVEVAWIQDEADFDIKTFDTFAYAVTGGAGRGIVLDISNPEAPFVTDTFPSAHNIYVDELGYLYASYPGLVIYDLNADPAHPQQVWTDGMGGGHDVVVKNDILYDFHGYEGTFIYDVADRTQPQLIGEIQDPSIAYHHSGDVSNDGNTLYICDELAMGDFADITTWNIAELENPEKIDWKNDLNATVHNFHILGDFAYVSYYSAGFRIYDISDPYQLDLVTEFDTNPKEGQGYTGCFGIYPFAGLDRIYVTDRDSGLMVFSITEEALEDEIRKEIIGLDAVNAYPNPADDSFTVEMTVPNMTEATVVLYDVAGRRIAVREHNNLNGYVGQTFATEGLASGIYVAAFQSGEVRKAVRVLVR